MTILYALAIVLDSVALAIAASVAIDIIRNG